MLGDECERICRIQDITVEGEALDLRLRLGQKNICSPESPTTVSCEWVSPISHMRISL